jgi:amylosucrase
LEKAIGDGDAAAIQLSVQKILLMQAHSIFIGGLPMLFYGDEVGYINDYSYLQDEGKSYDNRWMHRPVIDWKKNALAENIGTIEQQIFSGTQRLLAIRRRLPSVADHNNLFWLTPYTIHVAGFMRTNAHQTLYCLFNFSDTPAFLTWYALKERGYQPKEVFDHWGASSYKVGEDHEFLKLEAYGFYLLEQTDSEFLSGELPSVVE